MDMLRCSSVVVEFNSQANSFVNPFFESKAQDWPVGTSPKSTKNAKGTPILGSFV